MSELVHGVRPGLTRWEKWLRGEAVVLAMVALGFAAYYAWLGIFRDAEFPFATNSVAKDVLLAGVLTLVHWDVRRWGPAVIGLIIGVHVLMPVMLVSTLLGNVHTVGHTLTAAPLVPMQPTGPSARWAWFSVDVVTVASLLFLNYKAVRSRHDLRYLWPSGFRALTALSEVLVLRKDREVAPAEIGVRVDHYLASFRAREKYRVQLAFVALAYWPVLLLRPPFHIMSPDTRQRWIQRRFLDEVYDWLVPAFWRDTRRAIIRTAQQFCFMGYYGDEGAAARAGYLPFSKRKEYAERIKRVAPNRPRVKCIGAADIPGEELTADVVVVGTGAAGAMLAHELAQHGRDVLLLERGAHIDPSEFTENEATQLSNLFADGALTMTKDFRFGVVQGMCVGGSTVVNNAVCIPLPDDVRARWLDPGGCHAGLDPDELDRAFARVREILAIGEVQPADRLSPGGRRIAQAVQDNPRLPLEPVDCNISDCLGSGYCNIGCQFGKKLSALDQTLPSAQQRYGADRVRILPDCEVDKVMLDGTRASGVRARLKDGRRLTVRANTVVLSAGAIASSLILQRSGLGDGKAGRGLAFNMASPVTYDFDEPLHAERGLQITHVFRPTDDQYRGLAFETWYNPIVSQSLFMPGWFEAHWDNMRRYRNMTCLGVVAGTGNDASVKSTWLGRGLKFDYVPSDADFVKLKKGIRLACELGLEAGATRVMPSSLRLIDIRCKRDLTRIDDEIGDSGDISINSAHPQGGNPISRDAHKGVVDPSFRVYGAHDLYVCDASVFPTAITVNPQFTVMALAVYAAREIAGAPSRARVEIPRATVRAGIV
jgi:choline dehydrogenase-like flavoprotein